MLELVNVALAEMTCLTNRQSNKPQILLSCTTGGDESLSVLN